MQCNDTNDASNTVRDGKWDDFFSNTQILPNKERTLGFLEQLPVAARILDFGCGTGRWTAAFLRDRPDLVIDVLDLLLDRANLIPSNWNGKKYQIDFTDFVPETSYDGIWAYATLFFIPPDAIEKVFSKLAASLQEGGIFEFTMVEATEAAKQLEFNGMDKSKILSLLKQHHLKPLVVTFIEDAPYGPSRSVIPTLYIRAQKLHG